MGRVGPFERDHSSTAEEGWEDPRVCWHILPGFDSQRAASFDVGQQDAHGLLVDGDGALGVGLGVLDMQAAELAGWLTDGLVDPNGAADRVEIGSAKRKRFAESGASIGKAGKQGTQVRLGVVDRGCERGADLFGAGGSLHHMLVGVPFHEGHGVLPHGKPASLHAEPERAAQNRVDIAQRAPRCGWVLLDEDARPPLPLPAAQDRHAAASRGTGDSGGAAAALGDRLRLGAAALAGADDDQVMDSLLGPCSRPR